MADPPAFGATRNFTSSQFTATQPAGFPTSSFTDLVVGDFNGDGKLDVFVAYLLHPLEDRTNPMKLLLGDGLGGFTDATTQVFGSDVPSGVQPRQTVVADFNGDGRADIFVADHGFDRDPFPGYRNTLILSSGANGLVNATSTLPTQPDFSHSATYGDIDRDGDLDILVGNVSGGQADVYFLMNDGRGAFTRSFGRLPSNIEQRNTIDKFTGSLLFDADGDGDLDLFLGAHGELDDADSVILRNDGAGRFHETIATIASPPPERGVQPGVMDQTAVDLNGDGRLDLVLNYQMGGYATGRLQILINRPDGRFVDETASRIAQPVNSQNSTVRAYVADLNGDGHKDILLANQSDQPLYLNDGAGRFIRMPMGTTPGSREEWSIPADLNGDGRMDLFAAGFRSLFFVHLARDPGLSQTGDDAANGFMGDDDGETFSGLGGDDVIFAGAGDDTVSAGAGADTVVGGAGASYLRGDEGNDSVLGGAGFDDINGNMGDDTASGGLGTDWVVGGKDNDLLFGDAGADLVYGNLGSDTCHGGDGDDIVRGGQQDDLLNGGAGNDYLSGDRENDTLTGGAGADIFHSHSEAGVDRVTDFNRSEGDQVQLLAGSTYTVAQVGADTVISIGGAGAQLILVGVSMASLTGSWITA